MKQQKVRIKEGWEGAGKVGKVINDIKAMKGKDLRQEWTPVLWDGEDDPDFHKTAGLVFFEQDDTPEFMADVYVHGSDESLYEIGEKMGLTGEALSMFSHAMEILKVTLKVQRATGEAEIVAVDGRNLCSL